jgi:isoleucyl-tRNA synthetase
LVSEVLPMPFEKVETKIDFPAQERAILEFWQRTNAFEKLREKNRGKDKWSFLDGPITANNPMGVHHAWGRTYKDAYQRYFAMTGHELRYQNGFDCQGLWVEVEVEKELGLKSKRDIENLVSGKPFESIDRFVQLCKQRVDKFARIQTEQSIRLGYWMDWDRDEDWQKPPDQRRSYFTMSEENNYTIWSFLKKCHERGLIYRGYDAMPWCPRCAVGLSQMEMHEGYELVAHRAVFVRFPLRGRPGENLLVWTTTPWTLTSNVAAAVNPNLTYIKVKHRDEVYYLAKGALTAQRLEEQFKRKEWVEGVPKLKTLEQIFKEKGGFEVLGELSGAKMIGWTYDGPFDELQAQKSHAGFPIEIAKVAYRQGWAEDRPVRDVHRVIAWGAVGETEGTGIVHIAPGCGKEDFQLGKNEKLPPVAPLDEYGNFLFEFGVPLYGKSALDQRTADWIVNNLQQRGLLLATERYPHSYPHCWRCKTELLFRLVDEWFINMSWREEIMQVTETVTFLPESINGKARELDWLKNMGDWMISKKRFWGLALPIWVCDTCGAFEVIGSREELKQRAVEGWDKFQGNTPHRPWIDLVKIQCKCGGKASRIPDVGNPWLDAGIVPFSTMKYNTDPANWKKWFPADFITESFPGQFRNWFYAILAMSTMLEQRAPTKVILGHAQVRDEKGEEMHKSKGNAIPFEEAAEKMSADLMRWMFCRQNPANNINFGYGPADEIRNKFTMKLWHCYKFFFDYAPIPPERGGFDRAAPEILVKDRPDIDRWILSDLQLLIQMARREFESFNLMAFCLEAERFVDDKLSNWYIRRNRRRFWKSEQGTDKQAAYQTLYTVLTTLTKLFAPIMPFLTETMYQNLDVTGADASGSATPDTDASGSPVSVHSCDFPEADDTLIDKVLSAEMEALLRLVSLGSAARNSAKIKVRQPLAEMRVQPSQARERRAIERFGDQISEELNIKRVVLHNVGEPLSQTSPDKLWPDENHQREPLLRLELMPNIKSIGPKHGPRSKEIQAAFAKADQKAMQKQWAANGVVELAGVNLDTNDLIEAFKAPPGWAAIQDRGTLVAVDTRLTDDLKREGMAREVVRHVQNARKEAELQMEDRIELYLATAAEEIRNAINAHRSYIMSETLAVKWATQPLGGDSYKTTVKVDGQPLTIELRKIS